MAILKKHCGYPVEVNIGFLFRCDECGRETVIHNSESECLKHLRLVGWHIDERCTVCAPCVEIVRRRLERYHRENEEKRARIRHNHCAHKLASRFSVTLDAADIMEGYSVEEIEAISRFLDAQKGR